MQEIDRVFVELARSLVEPKAGALKMLGASLLNISCFANARAIVAQYRNFTRSAVGLDSRSEVDDDVDYDDFDNCWSADLREGREELERLDIFPFGRSLFINTFIVPLAHMPSQSGLTEVNAGDAASAGLAKQ